MKIGRTGFVLMTLLYWSLSTANGQTGISINTTDKNVQIKIGDEEFAVYDFTSYQKPVLYPLMAPGNISITRHYPMQQNVHGEAKDHPHHKSVWFAHGDVNGVDFWSEKGRIRCEGIDSITGRGFTAVHQWLSPSGETVCRDRTKISFDGGENWRSVNYHISIEASAGRVKLGDTKEGTFAVRTHPKLRSITRDGTKQALARNSEGVTGKAVWGKKAAWMNYQGKIDGSIYGITVMDHPTNLRHPTTWHARDYGLVAANPFGLHHFQKATKGAGSYVIQSGKQLDFRYRILITRGELTAEQINRQFDMFAK